MSSRLFSIFGEIAVDNSQANAALSATERQAIGTAKSMSGSLKQMGQATRGLGAQITMLTAPMIAFGAAALSASANFEEAMNRVEAVTEASGEDMVLLTELAREMGATTRYSATEAADALGYLGQAGFSATEMASALPGVLAMAAAENMELARAADIASGVLRGFSIEASEMGMVADVLALTSARTNSSIESLGLAFSYAGPIAQMAGQSFEETAAAIGLMANQGLKGERAGTALRMAMTRLMRPPRMAQEALSDLGIVVKDQQENLLSLADVMGQLEEAGAGITEMTKIFGVEAATGMTALLNEGGPALVALEQQLLAAGGSAEWMAETMEQGFKGAVRELASMFEELMLTIGDAGILEFGTTIVEGITQMVRGLTKLDPAVLRFVTVFGTFAIAAGPALLIIGQFTILISAALNPIGLAITGFIALGSAIAYLVGNAGGIAQFFKNIPGYALEAAEAIRYFGYMVAEGFSNGLEELPSKVVAAFRRMVQGVKDFLQISSPSDLFRQFGAWVVEGFSNGLFERAISFKEWVETARSEVQGFIPIFEEVSASIGAVLRGNGSLGLYFDEWIKGFSLSDAAFRLSNGRTKTLIEERIGLFADFFNEAREGWGGFNADFQAARTVTEDILSGLGTSFAGLATNLGALKGLSWTQLIGLDNSDLARIAFESINELFLELQNTGNELRAKASATGFTIASAIGFGLRRAFEATSFITDPLGKMFRAAASGVATLTAPLRDAVGEAFSELGESFMATELGRRLQPAFERIALSFREGIAGAIQPSSRDFASVASFWFGQLRGIGKDSALGFQAGFDAGGISGPGGLIGFLLKTTARFSEGRGTAAFLTAIENVGRSAAQKLAVEIERGIPKLYRPIYESLMADIETILASPEQLGVITRRWAEFATTILNLQDGYLEGSLDKAGETFDSLMGLENATNDQRLNTLRQFYLDAEGEGKAFWLALKEVDLSAFADLDTSSISSVVAAFADLFTSLDIDTGALMQQFEEAGGFSISGFINGFKNQKPQLKKTAEETFAEFIQSSRDAMGIASDSKPMLTAGYWAAHGFGVGFGSEMSNTYEVTVGAMEKILNGLVAVLSPFVTAARVVFTLVAAAGFILWVAMSQVLYGMGVDVLKLQNTVVATFNVIKDTITSSANLAYGALTLLAQGFNSLTSFLESGIGRGAAFIFGEDTAQKMGEWLKQIDLWKIGMVGALTAFLLFANGPFIAGIQGIRNPFIAVFFGLNNTVANLFKGLVMIIDNMLRLAGVKTGISATRFSNEVGRMQDALGGFAKSPGSLSFMTFFASIQKVWHRAFYEMELIARNNNKLFASNAKGITKALQSIPLIKYTLAFNALAQSILWSFLTMSVSLGALAAILRSGAIGDLITGFKLTTAATENYSTSTVSTLKKVTDFFYNNLVPQIEAAVQESKVFVAMGFAIRQAWNLVTNIFSKLISAFDTQGMAELSKETSILTAFMQGLASVLAALGTALYKANQWVDEIYDRFKALPVAVQETILIIAGLTTGIGFLVGRVGGLLTWLTRTNIGFSKSAGVAKTFGQQLGLIREGFRKSFVYGGQQLGFFNRKFEKITKKETTYVRKLVDDWKLAWTNKEAYLKDSKRVQNYRPDDFIQRKLFKADAWKFDDETKDWEHFIGRVTRDSEDATNIMQRLANTKKLAWSQGTPEIVPTKVFKNVKQVTDVFDRWDFDKPLAELSRLGGALVTLGAGAAGLLIAFNPMHVKAVFDGFAALIGGLADGSKNLAILFSEVADNTQNSFVGSLAKGFAIALSLVYNGMRGIQAVLNGSALKTITNFLATALEGLANTLQNVGTTLDLSWIGAIGTAVQGLANTLRAYSSGDMFKFAVILADTVESSIYAIIADFNGLLSALKQTFSQARNLFNVNIADTMGWQERIKAIWNGFWSTLKSALGEQFGTDVLSSFINTETFQTLLVFAVRIATEFPRATSALLNFATNLKQSVTGGINTAITAVKSFLDTAKEWIANVLGMAAAAKDTGILIASIGASMVIFAGGLKFINNFTVAMAALTSGANIAAGSLKTAGGLFARFILSMNIFKVGLTGVVGGFVLWAAAITGVVVALRNLNEVPTAFENLRQVLKSFFDYIESVFGTTGRRIATFVASNVILVGFIRILLQMNAAVLAVRSGWTSLAAVLTAGSNTAGVAATGMGVRFAAFGKTFLILLRTLSLGILTFTLITGAVYLLFDALAGGTAWQDFIVWAKKAGGAVVGFVSAFLKPNWAAMFNDTIGKAFNNTFDRSDTFRKGEAFGKKVAQGIGRGLLSAARFILGVVEGLFGANAGEDDPAAYRAGVSIIRAFRKGVDFVLENTRKYLVGYLEGFFGINLTEDSGPAYDAGKTIGRAIRKGFWSAVKGFTRTVDGYIQGFFGITVSEDGGPAFDAGKALGTAIRNGVMAALKELGGIIDGYFRLPAATEDASYTAGYEMGKKLSQGTAQGLKDKLTPDFGQWFGRGDEAEKEGEAVGGEYAGGVASGIEEGTPSVAGAIQQLSDALGVEFLPMEDPTVLQLELIARTVSMQAELIGESLPKGLLVGIRAGTPAVRAQAIADAAEILGGYREGFDSHSPSRGTITEGHNLTEGLSIGIQQGTPAVVTTAKDSAGEVVGAVEETVATGAWEDIFGGPITVWKGLIQFVKNNPMQPTTSSEAFASSLQMIGEYERKIEALAQKGVDDQIAVQQELIKHRIEGVIKMAVEEAAAGDWSLERQRRRLGEILKAYEGNAYAQELIGARMLELTKEIGSKNVAIFDRSTDQLIALAWKRWAVEQTLSGRQLDLFTAQMEYNILTGKLSTEAQIGFINEVLRSEKISQPQRMALRTMLYNLEQDLVEETKQDVDDAEQDKQDGIRETADFYRNMVDSANYEIELGIKDPSQVISELTPIRDELLAQAQAFAAVGETGTQAFRDVASNLSTVESGLESARSKLEEANTATRDSWLAKLTIQAEMGMRPLRDINSELDTAIQKVNQQIFQEQMNWSGSQEEINNLIRLNEVLEMLRNTREEVNSSAAVSDAQTQEAAYFQFLMDTGQATVAQQRENLQERANEHGLTIEEQMSREAALYNFEKEQLDKRKQFYDEYYQERMTQEQELVNLVTSLARADKEIDYNNSQSGYKQQQDALEKLVQAEEQANDERTSQLDNFAELSGSQFARIAVAQAKSNGTIIQALVKRNQVAEQAYQLERQRIQDEATSSGDVAASRIALDALETQYAIDSRARAEEVAAARVNAAANENNARLTFLAMQLQGEITANTTADEARQIVYDNEKARQDYLISQGKASNSQQIAWLKREQQMVEKLTPAWFQLQAQIDELNKNRHEKAKDGWEKETEAAREALLVQTEDIVGFNERYANLLRIQLQTAIKFYGERSIQAKTLMDLLMGIEGERVVAEQAAEDELMAKRYASGEISLAQWKAYWVRRAAMAETGTKNEEDAEDKLSEARLEEIAQIESGIKGLGEGLKNVVGGETGDMLGELGEIGAKAFSDIAKTADPVTALLKGIGYAAQAVGSIFQSIGDSFGELDYWDPNWAKQDFWTRAGSAIQNWGEAVTSLLSGDIGGVVMNLIEMWGSVIGDLSNGAAQVDKAFSEAAKGMERFGKGVAQSMEDITKSVMESKGMSSRVSRGGFLGLLGFTKEAVDPEIQEFVVGIFQSIHDALDQGFNAAAGEVVAGNMTKAEYAKAVKDTVFKALSEALTTAIMDAMGVMEKLQPLIAEYVDAMLAGDTVRMDAALGKINNEVETFIDSSYPQLLEGGRRLGGAFGQGVAEGIANTPLGRLGFNGPTDTKFQQIPENDEAFQNWKEGREESFADRQRDYDRAYQDRKEGRQEAFNEEQQGRADDHQERQATRQRAFDDEQQERADDHQDRQEEKQRDFDKEQEGRAEDFADRQEERQEQFDKEQEARQEDFDEEQEDRQEDYDRKKEDRTEAFQERQQEDQERFQEAQQEEARLFQVDQQEEERLFDLAQSEVAERFQEDLQEAKRLWGIEEQEAEERFDKKQEKAKEKFSNAQEEDEKKFDKVQREDERLWNLAQQEEERLFNLELQEQEEEFNELQRQADEDAQRMFEERQRLIDHQLDMEFAVDATERERLALDYAQELAKEARRKQLEAGLRNEEKAWEDQLREAERLFQEEQRLDELAFAESQRLADVAYQESQELAKEEFARVQREDEAAFDLAQDEQKKIWAEESRLREVEFDRNQEMLTEWFEERQRLKKVAFAERQRLEQVAFDQRQEDAADVFARRQKEQQKIFNEGERIKDKNFATSQENKAKAFATGQENKAKAFTTSQENKAKQFQTEQETRARGFADRQEDRDRQFQKEQDIRARGFAKEQAGRDKEFQKDQNERAKTFARQERDKDDAHQEDMENREEQHRIDMRKAEEKFWLALWKKQNELLAATEITVKPLKPGEVPKIPGPVTQVGTVRPGGARPGLAPPRQPRPGPVSVRGMAKGGLVTSPTLAVVGEAGPEIVIPWDEMQDFADDARIQKLRMSSFEDAGRRQGEDARNRAQEKMMMERRIVEFQRNLDIGGQRQRAREAFMDQRYRSAADKGLAGGKCTTVNINLGGVTVRKDSDIDLISEAIANRVSKANRGL